MNADHWDEVVDFLVVGSGAGAVCAALCVQDRGLSSLIVEKREVFGGTTGYSGGVAWIPNNPLMARDGVRDSYERSRRYLDAAVWYDGPATSAARREAFLRTGPEVVEYMEGKGMKFGRPDGYSDYYDDLPGGEPRSRSVIAQRFDLNELGEWKHRLAVNKGPPFRIGMDELSSLLLVRRTWSAKWKALGVGARLLWQALTGRDVRGAGAAWQGRMLQIALRERIPFRLNTPVHRLIHDRGRVTGVEVACDGKPLRIRTRQGVLINAGGFARNAEMRRQYGRQPSSIDWNAVSPGDTGEMIQEAMELGAATDCLDEAWWGITSRNVNGGLPEGAIAADGTPMPFGHHFDISFPHVILVDSNGQRFANEAGSYMELGQRLYARLEELGKPLPAIWAIIESRHRKRYPWGSVLGKTPKSWFDSGYMKRADTVEALAQQCGIDSLGLRSTVDRFNDFCKSGIDKDYGKGAKAFDRCHGDPTVIPNPNLGPIERAPFYAVAIYPGDVGTCGGLVTDEHARVLRSDGVPIEGLYATGNSTASVVGRSYPGAGASIGPALVFGYRAAQHVVSGVCP